MRKLFFLCFLFVAGTAIAQTGNALENTAGTQIIYAVLPDTGFTLKQILANRGEFFIIGDSLRPLQCAFYWLKITIANPDHFDGQYALEVEPHLENTYYYFDVNAQKWISQTAGIMTPANNGGTKQMATHILMQPQAANIVYVKMNVRQLKQPGLAIKPVIHIEKQSVIDGRQQILWAGWLISVSVLCFFFISNLYLYYSFRDRAVLFYLVSQLGAMVYITAYRRFFSFKIFTIRASTDGTIRNYGVNNLLMHLSILLLMFGFVQLTRQYLNTKKYLPRADAGLRYGLYLYTTLSVILMAVNVGVRYVESYILLYDNISVLLLASGIAGTCFAGYRLKLRASGAFLVAVTVPLGIMICIPLFFLFVSANGDNNLWLPNLGIVSDAVLFSVALVARTKLIQNDLRTKELEAKQLAFELWQTELQRNVAELEIQKINSDIHHEKLRSGLLQEKLEANQRELASTALYMVQKNELLARLKAEIEELSKLNGGARQKEFSGIESILKDSVLVDDDWAKFKLHFEQVHPHFFEQLLANHPSLTANEIRLYAYFHINLSTKEIANLLNIAPASVRQAKMRMYKKMGQPGLLAQKEPQGTEDYPL